MSASRVRIVCTFYLFHTHTNNNLSLRSLLQVQGKDPSVEFTQEIVEESEDERCFDDMMTGSDSVPPIELPGADMGRLEEISELVTSCLPSPIRREKLAVAIEGEGYIKKLLNVFREAIQWTLFFVP